MPPRAFLPLLLLLAFPGHLLAKSEPHSGPTIGEVEYAVGLVQARVNALQEQAEKNPAAGEEVASLLHDAQKNLNKANQELDVARTERQWKDRQEAVEDAAEAVKSAYKKTLIAAEGLAASEGGGPTDDPGGGDGSEPRTPDGPRRVESPAELPSIPEVGRIQRATLVPGASAVGGPSGVAGTAAMPRIAASGPYPMPELPPWLAGGDVHGRARYSVPPGPSRPGAVPGAGRAGAGKAGEALDVPGKAKAADDAADPRKREEALLAQARALMAEGKYWDALRVINGLIDLNPNLAEAYAMRAALRELLGARAAAEDDLRRAAQLDPRYADALEKALAGGRIYPPGEDDASILSLLLGGRLPRSPWLPAGAALLLAGGLGWAFLRRRDAVEGGARASRAALGGALRRRDRYELVRVIGHGGLGDVYEAKDRDMGRTVAVKKMSKGVLAAGAAARARFVREARTVASLQHPGIVGIYDVLDLGEDIYIVFEFVRGKTLHQVLAEEHALPLERTLSLLRPLCGAVGYAHGQGLVHRDIKPGNVMVLPEGGVKLMDFGLAKALSPRDSTDSAIAGAVDLRAAHTAAAGTPAYMAPEVGRGHVRPESDVYSLGVCLYEMATGDVPWDEAGDLLQQKMNMDFIRPSLARPGLPRALDEIVERALQPDPERRLRRAEELLAPLEAAPR